jgi:hypothetical protein
MQAQQIVWTQTAPTVHDVSKQVVVRYATTSYEFDDTYNQARTDITYGVGSITEYGDNVAIALPIQQWTDSGITTYTTSFICFDLPSGMDKNPETIDHGTIEGKRYLSIEYPVSFGEPHVVISYAIISEEK